MKATLGPQNQHWVPKFLLKNFCDTDGRVFCLDIETNNVTKPPPKNAASHAGFNDFEVDGQIVSYEERISRVESAAAPVLKRIAETASVAGLTADDRRHLADFMAVQSFRTEAFSKGMDPDLPRHQFGDHFAIAWRSAFLVSSEIASRHWAVMKIEHDDIFYLGDNPVVLQNTEKPEGEQQLGFDIKGIEAYLPVTPKCALYMPCRTVGEQIISGYQTAAIVTKLEGPSGGDSDDGKDDQLRLSEKIIRESTGLYRSLMGGTPYVAEPENVENLNYLQCMFSHRSIYSNRKDFAFARHVFARTPQYKETMKVHLAPLGSAL